MSHRPDPHRGHALILNYTATSYHWGCYGTSVSIYESLTRAGYAVMSLPVEITHAITTTPASAEDLERAAFQESFESANTLACQMMRDVDLVVINGEGTLHRDHAGSRNLLAMAYIAAARYGRPVHMVNHSCFPNGDNAEATPEVEALYRTALGACTRRVAREPLTKRHCERWGLEAAQGFDCLPDWLERHAPDLRHAPSRANVLIAGGVGWYEQVSEFFAEGLKLLPADWDIRFLGGAYRREPFEDQRTMDALSPLIPSLTYTSPQSANDWLAEIASASLLITGRFHHAVAAAALGTPFISIASNTPKTNGVTELLDMPEPLDPFAPTLTEDLRLRLDTALAGGAPATTPAQQRLVRELAQANFGWEQTGEA
ncbi:MAG TPA: polysaccharide pyruvyl transferase family protein [Brevundimonas sp.]|uniref:polysaccharide pyruvyl transferase family protein n=1 Tax=Brevundimonas sp. TaxID=1871086 RepID=UPI002B7FAEC5|nr:polysaccharide pyruvyl transferase family protein [Brevundimonas sp.]HRH19647.1 polysaccharide pyruvyl transferase family protein [Brevundimonas sp.]